MRRKTVARLHSVTKKQEARRASILAAAFERRIPATVHVAMGTDIIHQHPSTDGVALGKGSLLDFRILAGQLPDLGQGGAVINFGSAVIMPEVFLKALTVARNLGADIREKAGVTVGANLKSNHFGGRTLHWTPSDPTRHGRLLYDVTARRSGFARGPDGYWVRALA